MAITCPNGHVNDDGNRFCDQCGARLEAAPAGNTSAAPDAPAQSVPAASGSSDASVTCPTCGQENLPGTAFCENCGAPLQPPQPVAMPSETGAPAGGAGGDAAEGIVCPNCGARNEPGHAFCEQCGAALQGASATPANMPDQSAQQDATSAAAAAHPEPLASQATAPPIEGGAQSTVSATPDEGAMAAATATVDAAPPPADAAPAPQPEPTPEPEPELAPAIAQASSPAPAPQAMAPEAGPQGEACANCGAALPPNAKFCMECGTRVERQPQMVRPTHCQNCGSELPPNAKFCLECGAKVEMIPAGSEKPAAQPVEATYQQQAAESPAAVPAATLPGTPDVALQPVEAQSAPPETAPPVPQPQPETPQAQPVTATTSRTYDITEAAAPAPVGAPPQTPSPAVAAPPAVTPPAVIPSQPAQMSGGGPRLIGPDGATISLPPKNELVIGREDPISGIHPDIDMTAHGGEAGGVSRRHALLRQQNGQWSIVDLDSTNYTRVDGSRVAPHDAVPLHEGARVQFGRIEFTFHAQ